MKSYSSRFLFILFGVLALTSTQSFAQSSSKSGGLAFDGALGIPNAQITNPDSSNAYYTGLSAQARLIAPVFEAGLFSTSLTGAIRYLDLKNTANDQSQKEFSNHLGPGAGLRLAFAKLYLGAEYFYMYARHYSVGNVSKEINYKYMPLVTYFGLTVPVGQLALGFSYSMATGSVPAAESGLSKSSPYKDAVVFFHLTWNTGSSAGDFVGKLFK